MTDNSDMIISNVNVYGLDNAIRVSKFPMATDVSNADFEVENLRYWTQFGNFISDFLRYQNNYGKNKGKNTKESCIFCGDNTRVQKHGKLNNDYYCSKCRKQIDRYGEAFETSPKYTLKDGYVEMTVYGEKRREQAVKISYQSLPMVFKHNWHTNGNTYIKNENGEMLHVFLCKDLLRDDLMPDHINRDIFDNRIENLRVCTKKNNSRNCNISKNNTSGVTGVAWKKDKNKWKAYINNDGKQIHLGYYEDFDDAVKARLIVEKSLFKEFAPQKHLFEQYGISNEDEVEFENTFEFNLQEAIKSFKRAKKLGNTKTGSAHDQYLTGIIVQFDLTFTVKAWTEAERYHFFDFISSQSTVHRISKFDLNEQYIEYVDPRMIEIMNELKDKYNETNDPEDYLRLLYNNPCGFKLTAGMTTNYRQLKTIYQQRKDHRLPEWREFCRWVETLPYFKEIVLGEDE